MSWLFMSNGVIKVVNPATLAEETLTLPADATVVDSMPFYQRYGQADGFYNTYLSGSWSRPLLRAYGTLYAAGMNAPLTAPTVSASGTGFTADAALCCYTRARYNGTQKITESNPSAKAAPIALVNQGVRFQGLSATENNTSNNDGATHFRLYISLDGSLSYVAATIPIATTDYTVTGMSNEELEQQDTLPIKFDDTGSPLDDVLARGVPPYSTVILRWKQRMWYIDPTKPGVVKSGLNELEAVNEDPDESFVPTTGGEYVLGLGALDDELVLFCEDVGYSLMLGADGSISMRKVDDGTRFIAPASPVTIQGMILFASDQGVCAYAGGGGNGFRNLMAESWRRQWVADYAANVDAYQLGSATDDRVFGDYVFAPFTSTCRTIRGYYKPMTERGESEPWWYYGDVRDRRLGRVGQIYLSGSHRGVVAYGECDGIARRDDAADLDDDGDTAGRVMKARHKVFYKGDPSGDAAHGRAYTNLDAYVTQGSTPRIADQVDVTIKVYAGDDNCIDADPQKEKVIVPLPDEGQQVNPTSRTESLEEVSGKAICVEINVTQPPAGVEWRGFGVHFDDTGSGGPG